MQYFIYLYGEGSLIGVTWHCVTEASSFKKSEIRTCENGGYTGT